MNRRNGPLALAIQQPPAYPGPQILLFDLDKASHRENIDWIASAKIYGMEAGAAVGFDVEEFLKQKDVNAILEGKARAAKEQLDYQESIVDLLKLLGQDSGLGARNSAMRATLAIRSL